MSESRSKEGVRVLVAVSLFLLAGGASSTPPLDAMELTPTLMGELGFTAKNFKEDGTFFAQLIGPRNLHGDCYPQRAGSFLFHSSGELVAFQSAWFEARGEIALPTAEGTFTDVSMRMRLFVDYFCASNAQKSKRYFVDLSAVMFIE